jgi:kynurenine formamidase
MSRSGMRIQRVIDLSIAVDEHTQVYPGDPVVELHSATRIETDGFNVLSIALGSHTGTHVDAPYHFVADGPQLGELDLGLFAGPGVIADVTGHEPRQPIVWSDIVSVSDRVGPGTILVLRTGWSEAHLRSDRYFDHPFLDPDACAQVLDRGVRTIAIDALNPDPTVLHGEAAFPVHQLVLGAGGVIAENLTHLSAVHAPDPLLCMFPIRLGGDADGAPCRAVALELASD